MANVTYKYINSLLRNWKKSTQHIDETTKPHLKTLYAGLKELDPAEYKILHQKFLTGDNIASNAELAEYHNLTTRQMEGEVSKARARLQNIIIEQSKENDNDKQNNAGTKQD